MLVIIKMPNKVQRGGYSVEYEYGQDIIQFLTDRCGSYLQIERINPRAVSVLGRKNHDQGYNASHVIAMGKAIISKILQEDFKPSGTTPSGTTTEQPYTGCYDRFTYVLAYPICWFRSMCVMLFFDQTFRDTILLGSEEIKVTTDTTPLDVLKKFVYATANYYGVKMTNKLKTEHWSKARNNPNSLLWLQYTTHVDFSAEDLWLYFMTLLNAYDSWLFPHKDIEGGKGHIYSPRFFKHLMPKLAPDTAKDGLVHRVIVHRGLVKELGKQGSQPPYVVLNYNNWLTINSGQAHLAMFVRVNGKVYTLSSLLMTTYFNWKWLRTRPWEAHQFSIFKCNRKYYSLENKFNAGNESVSEVPLVRYLLVDGIYPDIIFREFLYDLNRSIRVGLYTRSLFMFSEDELTLLNELSIAIKKRDWYTVMAALTYFTKSATININVIPERSRGSTAVTPLPTMVTYKFWNHIDNFTFPATMYFSAIQEGPARSLRITIGETKFSEEQLSYTGGIVKNITGAWRGHMTATSQSTDKQQIFEYLVPRNNLQCASFTARNVVQTDTLLGLMKDLNAYVAPQGTSASGGGVHIRIKKTNKTYQVRKDKQGKKYIVQNKHKIYLSDIKGSYLRA